MRHCHRLLIVAAALLTGPALLQAAKPRYPIKLDRPAAAGDSYDAHVTIDVSRKRTITTPGTPDKVDGHTTKGDLAGRVHVATIDQAGAPKVFTLTVTKFTAGPAGKELVPPGEVISITRTQTAVTAVLTDNKPLSPEALEVIHAIFHPVVKGAPSADEALGTKTPQAVGDSWPINAENVAKDAASHHVVVDAKDISGRTTLKGVEKINGGEALRVASDVVAKDLKQEKLPAGIKAAPSRMEVHQGGLFPVDVSLPPVEGHLVMDITMNATANGGATSIKVVEHVEQTEKITNITK